GAGAAALGGAVGAAVGVGAGAVAGQLGVDPGAAAFGVPQLLEDQHAGALAQDEAVAVAVEGPAGLPGGVVALGQGGEQVEAGDAERVDHAVRAAGEHDVGVAVADQLDGLADGLAAAGAGGQAVVVGAVQAEVGAEVAGGGVQLLLGLLGGVEVLQPAALEAGEVQVARLGAVGLGDQRHQVGEVLDALAGAEV